MKTFTIDTDNNITAFGSLEEATAAASTTFFDFHQYRKGTDRINHRPAGGTLGSHLEQPAGRGAGEALQEQNGRVARI